MTTLDDPTLSNSLTDLAARIRAEHDGAHAAIKRGIEHAIAAGALLIEAKAQLQHGQWLPWLKEHCGLSERSARNYMRLARNRQKLAENGNVADLSLRGAIDALAQHMPDDEPEEIELPPPPLRPGEIEIPIEAIIWRRDLYPRLQVRQDIVDRYRHFLRDLPAITINQRNELIDGWHRLEAFKTSGAKTIRVRVEHVENDLHHLLRACKANATHGEQLPLDVVLEHKREREQAERLALSIERGRRASGEIAR